MSRKYSTEELTALRAAFPGTDLNRGPTQYAGGDWWPTELERRAAEAEAQVPKLRLAAAALRREIQADPLTSAPVDALKENQ